MRRWFACFLALAMLLSAASAYAGGEEVTVYLSDGTKLNLKYEGISREGVYGGTDMLAVKVSGFGGTLFTSEDGTAYSPVEAKITLFEQSRVASWVRASTSGTYTFFFDVPWSGFDQLYVRNATSHSFGDEGYRLLYDAVAVSRERRQREEERRRREAEAWPEYLQNGWYMTRFTLRALSDSGDETMAVSRDFLTLKASQTAKLMLSAKGRLTSDFDASEALSGMLEEGQPTPAAANLLEKLSFGAARNWICADGVLCIEPVGDFEYEYIAGDETLRLTMRCPDDGATQGTLEAVMEFTTGNRYQAAYEAAEAERERTRQEEEQRRMEAEAWPDAMKAEWHLARLTLRAPDASGGEALDVTRDYLAEGVERTATLTLSGKGNVKSNLDARAILADLLTEAQLTDGVSGFLEKLSFGAAQGWKCVDGMLRIEPVGDFEATYSEAEDALRLVYRGADDGTASGTLEAVMEFMPREGYREALARSVEEAMGSEGFVTFGCWEQDGDPDNGAEQIEWIVLESDNETATLISRYALIGAPYHDQLAPMTWENCTLRGWLNGEFLSAAFTPEEQESLETVTVVAQNTRADEYGDPGSDTQDRVFVLDRALFDQYFKSGDAAKTAPTEAALAQGVEAHGENGNCWWWLRPYGCADDGSAGIFVDETGYSWIGLDVNSTTVGVRPVIKVRL